MYPKTTPPQGVNSDSLQAYPVQYPVPSDIRYQLSPRSTSGRSNPYPAYPSNTPSTSPYPQASQAQPPSAAQGLPPVQQASSLTQCKFMLKEAYRIDPGIPGVQLDTIAGHELDFDSKLEKDIIASNASLDGSASDDLFASLGNGAPSTVTTTLPVQDAWADRIRTYERMGYTPESVRLALVKYSSEAEQHKVLDFCQNFAKLKETLPSKTDYLLASALWQTEGEDNQLLLAANQLM